MTDILEMHMDQDFNPAPAFLPPEAKQVEAYLEEIAALETFTVKEKNGEEVQWGAIPLKFKITDSAYLTEVARSDLTIKDKLLVELVPNKGALKAPRSQEDNTNNGFRRFVKNMGGQTSEPLSNLVGKSCFIKITHQEQKRDGKPFIDEETGLPFVKAVVSVVRAPK